MICSVCVCVLMNVPQRFLLSSLLPAFRSQAPGEGQATSQHLLSPTARG